jgi:TP53 regulating kinase-like protein
MISKTIAQGAEAKIHLTENKIVKERIVKGYRLPLLDEQIRKSRTKKEAKLLIKAKEVGVNIPAVLNADKKGIPKDKYNLEIEFIDGDKLSEKLNSYKEEKQFEVMKNLGHQVAILHKHDIIHGDLTTSNAILLDDKIYIIDFGLGFISKRLEDKAVDLHLIKQALEAKHWQNHKELFRNFLEGYKWEKAKSVCEQLKKVESRGRYRH